MSAFYFTVNDAEEITVISRSKFLTFIHRVESEQSAARLLEGYRKKYYDATHVCFAWRIGADGDRVKFSDDKEPQGTAGAPILAALKSAQITNALAIVVRYFGGIKLGAGGLTRAYGGCAAQAIAAGGTVKYALCKAWLIRAQFSVYKTLLRAAQEVGAIALTPQFSQDVEFKLLFPDADNGESVEERLKNAANGKIFMQRLDDEYAQVPH